ncbi:MAG: ABC transporter ATP-binding protein, partial [Mycobacteriales bacterium]
MSTHRLPVADRAVVRRKTRELLRRHRRTFLVTLALHAAAAVAGLVGPRVLGAVIDGLRHGITRDDVDRLALLFGTALLAQSLLTGWARFRGAVLGEQVLAELREEFLERAVALPLGTVERAGTGDLVARATADTDRLAYAVRQAAPEISVALLYVALIAIAAFVTSPQVAVAMLVGVVVLAPITRWYRRRAPAAYQREMAASAQVTAGIVETADAGRTVEALRLASRRVERTDADVREFVQAELGTLRLRSVWFPAIDFGFVLPMVAIVALGGLLVRAGGATVGQVTAVALYWQMVVEPLDVVLSWLDELQIGTASMARLLGVAAVPQQPVGDDVPASDEMVARDVRFAYRAGHDVLHDVSLSVSTGTRIAVVGPSGAGKSTLGRLLAGVHPPRTGSVTVGGAEVSLLPAEVLREQVSLVTQEHHVFVGTIRDNVVLARPGASDEDVWAALDAVDAAEWVGALPDGLDTVVGERGYRLS